MRSRGFLERMCELRAIVAEIGDARQFKDAKQLVAYAGLDPGIFSSGKFTATSSKITKRGSKRLRRSLYLAVQCGIRGSANRKSREYYDKKMKEGKPYKVVVIACANKLLHHVFAILSKNQPYKAKTIFNHKSFRHEGLFVMHKLSVPNKVTIRQDEMLDKH